MNWEQREGYWFIALAEWADLGRQPISLRDYSWKEPESFAGAPLTEAMRWAREDSAPMPDGMVPASLQSYAQSRTMEYRRLTMQPTMAGPFVNVGAFCAGEAECMLEPTNVEASQPVFRVAVNPSVLAKVPASAIHEGGRLIMQFCDALNVAGYSVALDVVHCTNASPHGLAVRVYPLKRAGEALVPNRIALMGRPEMVRRLSFRVLEQSPRFDGRCYGGPAPLPADVAAHYDVIIEGGHAGTGPAYVASFLKSMNDAAANLGWSANWREAA